MMSKMPKVFNTKRAINHLFWFALAATHSEYPFQNSVHTKIGISSHLPAKKKFKSFMADIIPPRGFRVNMN